MDGMLSKPFTLAALAAKLAEFVTPAAPRRRPAAGRRRRPPPPRRRRRPEAGALGAGGCNNVRHRLRRSAYLRYHVYVRLPDNINPMMEGMLWILLPGFVAVAAGLLAWFVMQSRMEVALAEQRTDLAEIRGSLDAEKAAMQASMQSALRAAEEIAKRQALDDFLGELRVDQRHYTRENRLLLHNRAWCCRSACTSGIFRCQINRGRKISWKTAPM